MKKKGIDFYNLVALCMLLDVTACGRNESSGQKNYNISTEKLGITQEDVARQGNVTYLAVLNSLNSKVAGNVSGSFTFHKENDFVVMDVRVSGSAPNIIHSQNVHVGTFCPTIEADTNQDGIVDLIEARQSVGGVIIPLDADINNQYSLLGMFPIADNWGAYIYSQTASFERLLEDLKSEDENVNDDVLKLGDLPLTLIGKAIMINGIADDVILAESVSTAGGLTANQSLPVACGIITKVVSIPGTFEPDDITIGSVRSGGHSNGQIPQDASTNGRTDSNGRINHQTNCPNREGKSC